MVYKTSPSKLNRYAAYIEGKIELDDLIRDIKGETTETPYMIAGRAFHSILEEPEKYVDADLYICDGYKFDKPEVDEKVLSLLPKDIVPEVWGEKKYRFPTGEIVLRGRCDGLNGRVYEHKTNWTRYSFLQYNLSWQWPCYIELFRVSEVVYTVVSLATDNNSGLTHISQVNTFSLHRYPGLSLRVERLIEGYLELIQQLKLEEYCQYKPIMEFE